MKNKITLIISTAFLSISMVYGSGGNGVRHHDPPNVMELKPVSGQPWSMEARLQLTEPSQQDREVVNVYPNPADRNNDLLNVTLPGTGKKQLAFYDITGKLIYSMETEKQQLSISLTDLGPGVYLLNVKTGKMQTTKKVIIR